MLTFTLLQEKCREWHKPLWVAAVDFKKAFDTVRHSYLWDALVEAEVPDKYIQTLQKLYNNQTGVVVGEKVSKEFSIDRGTKQGDPISPPLFNCVLERIFRKVKPDWNKKKYGFLMDSGALLQNLRFADDVLVIGKSEGSREHATRSVC